MMLQKYIYITLKGLGATKGESRGVAMMPKIGMKVAQDYKVSNM